MGTVPNDTLLSSAGSSLDDRCHRVPFVSMEWSLFELFVGVLYRFYVCFDSYINKK